MECRREDSTAASYGVTNRREIFVKDEEKKGENKTVKQMKRNKKIMRVKT